MRKLLLVLAVLFAAPVMAANHPASSNSANCNNTNTCAFGSTGGLVVPAANQIMVILIGGPNSSGTLSSITDTYSGTQNCSGSSPNRNCGNWKMFSVGAVTVANSFDGYTGLYSAYWEATGSNSGAESLTLAFSSGTAIFMYMTSWAATDINVTAANVEDTSVFMANPNANTCTNPTLESASFTTNFANDVVMSLLYTQGSFQAANNPNSNSGTIYQGRIIGSSSTYYASLSAWSGSTGTLQAIAAGTYQVVWNMSSCTATAGAASAFTVALKGPSTTPTRHIKSSLTNYHPVSKFTPQLLYTILRNWFKEAYEGRA